MTGEDFQYLNPHAHAPPQMVEAGEGGFQHSQYSPKHAETDVGCGGGNPYFIADKTMTELSSLPPPYEQIDGTADHVSSMNYETLHNAEAAAVAVAAAGLDLSIAFSTEFAFDLTENIILYPGREDTLSQAMSIALGDQCNSSSSNSGFDVSNWSGGQGEFLYHAGNDVTFDLSTHHHGSGVGMNSNG